MPRTDDSHPSWPGTRSFRALIDHGLDLLELIDAEGRILYASPSAERVLGYPPEELVGADGLSFSTAEQKEKNRAWLEHILAHPETSHHFGTRIRHRDGSRRDLEISVQNLLDEPDVGALVVNARDVTEREETERRLRERDAQFRLLAENARDIIVIFERHPEPRHAYISPSAERILGYDRQTFYDDPHIFRRILHPEDAGKVEEIRSALRERRAHPITARWIHRDGHIVWLEQISVPVYDERGELTTVYVISRDVTEKVQLEEQLRRSQRMEALGRLAGGMAHDFNNLLSAALLSSDRLERMSSGDARILEGLDEIRGTIDRGISLTRQLLTFSQRDSEPAQPLDAHRTIIGLESVLRRLIPEDISFELRLRAAHPIVRLGRSELEQVILNLALNSRDAMPEGGSLLVESEDVPARGSRSPRLALSVRDDGAGMDEEERAQVFEPFFTTKESTGYGLGMAVVHSVVERSGGAIHVESSPGRGTEITIEWPVCDEAPVPGEVPVPAEGPSGHQETVLVVEDDAALRRLTVEILTARGYRTLAAGDGEEARRALAREDIDLLLTDLVIPRGSGQALAEQLARAERDTAIIYMSGYATEAQSARAASRRGAFLLNKPFTEATLARTVRDALDAR